MATKLHVGNVSYTTTAETLRAVFSADGRQVSDVSVMTGHKTGESRGFAFVQMATEADAQAAIAALDGREVDGRAIKVNAARGLGRRNRLNPIQPS